MAKTQPLWIFDKDGPKADADPQFVAVFGFINATTGAARAQPAGGFANRGGGQYTLQPTDDDELVGTIALIDCGVGCFPRYQYLAICRDDNQFALAVPFDENGELSSPVNPFSVGSFVDLTNGSSRPPPAVVQVASFDLYTITPSAADVAIGVGLRVDGAPGVFPPTANQAFFGAAPAGATTTGAFDDLCDVIDLLASGIYTVTRRAPPAYVRGRRAPPLEAVFTTTASVQPASGQEVQRLPEGKRSRETITMFSCVELKPAALAQEPDVVAIDGGSFEVESVQRWAALGNYCRAVLTRRPGT